MADNNGTNNGQVDLKEVYRPLNNAYRNLTDDRNGKVRKLMYAQEKNPEAPFFIIAKLWGRYAITIAVADDTGEHAFTIGRTVESFIAFARSDNPDDMKNVSQKAVPEITEVLMKLAQYIDYQLAQLIEKPEVKF